MLIFADNADAERMKPTTSSRIKRVVAASLSDVPTVPLATRATGPVASSPDGLGPTGPTGAASAFGSGERLRVSARLKVCNRRTAEPSRIRYRGRTRARSPSGRQWPPNGPLFPSNQWSGVYSPPTNPAQIPRFCPLASTGLHPRHSWGRTGPEFESRRPDAMDKRFAAFGPFSVNSNFGPNDPTSQHLVGLSPPNYVHSSTAARTFPWVMAVSSPLAAIVERDEVRKG